MLFVAKLLAFRAARGPERRGRLRVGDRDDGAEDGHRGFRPVTPPRRRARQTRAWSDIREGGGSAEGGRGCNRYFLAPARRHMCLS